MHNYEEKNILEYLIKNKNVNYSELIKLTKKCYSKLHDNKKQTNYDKCELWEKVGEKKRRDNLMRIKSDEEKLNDPDNIYTIDIKKINYDEILGIEEVFDFKKRFCSCKCLSDKADIRYITIYDLLKLIINSGESELKYLLKMINERKNLLKYQIINAIKNEERKIVFNFDIRYENLLNEAEHKITTQEKRKNQIFSTIKMKGYKHGLHDILDNNIPLMETEKNEKYTESYVMTKKIKKSNSTETLLKSLFSKRKNKNKVKLKIVKNIFNKRSINFQNVESAQINPYMSIQNSAGTFSKNPYSKKINHTRNSRSCINFSNTGESFFVRYKKRKASNYSGDKNAKTTKYSFERTSSKINFEASKTIDNSPNIQNFKVNNKVNLLKNNTCVRKEDKFKDKKGKDTFENINLPNLFEEKNMRKTSSNLKSIIKKNINNYQSFSNFYNLDKKFFASNEFKNQLINGHNSYKIKSFLEKDKKILKN